MEPVLAIGAAGEWVTYLQECLAAAGFDPGGADGAFGPRTRHAVQDYQGSQNLVADGVVGPLTWAALTSQPDTGQAVTTDELVEGDGPPPLSVPTPDLGNDHPCQYQPGEKEWSATEPGSAGASTGLLPTAQDLANESARAVLCMQLGVDDEHLDERCRELGLPDPPPRFTPPLDGTFVLSGFEQGSTNLKDTHFAFIEKLVTELALNTDHPRYTVTRIEGFTDCVDSFSTNVGIRLARAQHTRAALINAGAREEYIGPAVASTAESLSAETGPTGRAANRAALGVLSLVPVPRTEPPVDIPPYVVPSCEEPSDTWFFGTQWMVSGGEGVGGAYIHVFLWNNRTGCRHDGHIAAVGGTAGTAPFGFSISSPNAAQIDLLEEVFSFQLSGLGVIHWAEIGRGLGRFEGTLFLHTGALAGIDIDLGGWQLMTPGGDFALMECYLHVEEPGTPDAPRAP